eukprot:m.213706 g.213706  ORF g.213706 m.213706 type:complete len:166 (+) comp33158_c2_seq1:390-887(+)
MIRIEIASVALVADVAMVLATLAADVVTAHATIIVGTIVIVIVNEKNGILDVKGVGGGLGETLSQQKKMKGELNATNHEANMSKSNKPACVLFLWAFLRFIFVLVCPTRSFFSSSSCFLFFVSFFNHSISAGFGRLTLTTCDCLCYPSAVYLFTHTPLQQPWTSS